MQLPRSIPQAVERRQRLAGFNVLAVTLGVGLSLTSITALAAAVDIADTPLIIATPSSVSPNLLFILDDSGSMGWDYMPDHVVSGFCRATGAGIAPTAMTGTFTSNCCTNSACWTGSVPFGSKAHPPFLSSDFNSMAYNPAIRYSPPKDDLGNELKSMNNANTGGWTVVPNDYYKTQTSVNINLLTQFPDVAWCTDENANDCLRNDNYVLPGVVKVGGVLKLYDTPIATRASGTAHLATGSPDQATVKLDEPVGPHYYRIVAGEYCSDDSLRDCQTTPTAVYKYEAKVRWCDSAENARLAQPAAGSCQVNRIDSGTRKFIYPRYPTVFASGGSVTPATASFTISSNTTCSQGVSAVWVNGANLISAATSGSTSRTTIASRIASAINSGGSGYTATPSGATVTVYAPTYLGAITHSLSLQRRNNNCSLPYTPAIPKFGGYAAGEAMTWYGRFERVDILSGKTFPKGEKRTDCAGAECSYAEEMTNFANWWAYYHTRMQAMKTSTSRAFAELGENRRLGYLSINNGTGKDFLNLGDFEGAHRAAWFTKLFKADPGNSTPLRTALSKAGQLFGGRLNGTSLNGSTVVEPMQYSCQKNFTILSTDGYWNETATPTQLDRSTAIGDTDSAAAVPKRDAHAVSNSLSDVSMYYYNNDLRPHGEAAANCTSPSGEDLCGKAFEAEAQWQRMYTFTLGLGASGFMRFLPGYLSASSGDYAAIANGTNANPAAGICVWQESGACSWPKPVSNTLTTIDDLWHAAVNGNGTYISADSPDSLFSGLSKLLRDIGGRPAAAAAATTSNPNVVSGDDNVFISSFTSGEWSGQLVRQQINLETGDVYTDAARTWSARDKLNQRTTERLIYTAGAGGNTLKPFTWAELSGTEKAFFELAHVSAAARGLSQFCSLGEYCVPVDDRPAAVGEALVNYLRGDRSLEGELEEPSKPLRARKHLMGDIVNSEAVYVGGSLYKYTDDGYGAFAATQSTRSPMLYVGSNDGMLHALRADNGEELWAYVPSDVLPDLYRLADKEYATRHRYFVDGSPVVRDVKLSSGWATVMVFGLGAGGRSYVAMDITDPTAPKLLWEFRDNRLGLTYGRPEIGKLANGEWKVFFGSGYNNSAGGNHLFVVNLETGAAERVISTPSGSGMAHISAWVDDGSINNTILRVYGGDNEGNVWRFDVNNSLPGSDALQLVQLRTADNKPQPITSRPELGEVKDADGTLHAMVFVGTGRYLGNSDIGNSDQQSIYGIKDKLGDTTHPAPRSGGFVKQTLIDSVCPGGSQICTAGESVRQIPEPQPVDLKVDNGWFVDLPVSKERVNTDPLLVAGTLIVNSNIIGASNACSVGGSSFANYLDYATGGAVATANGIVSVPIGEGISTAPAVVKLPNNKVVTLNRITDATGDKTVVKSPPLNALGGPTRRLSWRELVQ